MIRKVIATMHYDQASDSQNATLRYDQESDRPNARLLYDDASDLHATHATGRSAQHNTALCNIRSPKHVTNCHYHIESYELNDTVDLYCTLHFAA
jgi:hypothetical protein